MGLTTNVVCTYRTGGDFDVDYVNRLHASVRRNTNLRFRFVCHTDAPEGLSRGIETRELVHGLPGWWSKLEMFRETGPTLALDLDTVVVRNVNDLLRLPPRLQSTEFGTLRGFYRGDVTTGIMAWNGDVSRVLRTYLGLPDRRYFDRGNALRMRVGGGEVFRGDQEWLGPRLSAFGLRHFFLQDRTSGIKSYKVDCVGGLPADARVVCFHGSPRPVEVHKAWMGEYHGG